VRRDLTGAGSKLSRQANPAGHTFLQFSTNPYLGEMA
jgi:hypothetical protein